MSADPPVVPGPACCPEAQGDFCPVHGPAPGPASVSPADTPEPFSTLERLQAMRIADLETGTNVLLARIEALEQDVAAEKLTADALLAVGERDKAELERALRGETHWARECERLAAERERDRRQIARLTEALEHAKAAIDSILDTEDAPAPIALMNLQDFLADAVLADEEDAP